MGLERRVVPELALEEQQAELCHAVREPVQPLQLRDVRDLLGVYLEPHAPLLSIPVRFWDPILTHHPHGAGATVLCHPNVLKATIVLGCMSPWSATNWSPPIMNIPSPIILRPSLNPPTASSCMAMPKSPTANISPDGLVHRCMSPRHISTGNLSILPDGPCLSSVHNPPAHDMVPHHTVSPGCGTRPLYGTPMRSIGITGLSSTTPHRGLK